MPVLSTGTETAVGSQPAAAPAAAATSDLTNATVRLLLNLSFDSDLRNQMVKVGMLPKLVQLMADAKQQNPICCVLYHLSIDDKGDDYLLTYPWAKNEFKAF